MIQQDVEIIDDFLPPSLADRLSKYVQSVFEMGSGLGGFNHQFATNTNWPLQLTVDQIPDFILIHILQQSNEEGILLNSEIDKVVNDFLSDYPAKIVHGSYVQYFTPQSQIGWHPDVSPDNRIGAFTLYLNRTWKHEYGGHFLYVDDNGEQQMVLPKFNRAVITRSGVMHKVMPIVGRHMRKSLQNWIYDNE